MGLFGLQRAAFSGGLNWPLALEWVGLVFMGILVHELGHAVAFRHFGKKPEVTLYAMGGLTSARGQLSPGRRLITTLAGPGVGLVIGGLVFLAVQQGLWDPRASTFQRQVYLDLLFINVGWGVLNLVPLYPLDGGQSLEAFLGLMRVKSAEMITSAVSVTVAAAAGYWAATNGQFFILLIAFFLGFQNIRRLGALRNPAKASEVRAPAVAGLSPQLQRTIELVDQSLQQGRPDEAVEMLEQEYRLRPGVQSGQAYAAVLARTQRYDELERLALADHERLGQAALATSAAALVAGGRYDSALRTAEAGWNADPNGHWQHAVTAAAARAGLRDIDGAVRWLYMAIDRGWTDRRRLESDPVFAEVRSDPRMGDILTRMGV